MGILYILMELIVLSGLILNANSSNWIAFLWCLTAGTWCASSYFMYRAATRVK